MTAIISPAQKSQDAAGRIFFTGGTAGRLQLMKAIPINTDKKLITERMRFIGYFRHLELIKHI
jgi:hypothetical protein